MTDEQFDPHAKILAGKVLTITAAAISEPLNNFSSWMLAGLGAAYSLVFANMAALQNFVSVHSIRNGLILLLIALPLGLFQRLLAAQISASSAVSEKVEAATEKLLSKNVKLDLDVFNVEMEKGLFFPFSFFMRWGIKKARAGDFAVSGRLAARLSQIQTWTVFIQTVVVIGAVVVIISGLKV